MPVEGRKGSAALAPHCAAMRASAQHFHPAPLDGDGGKQIQRIAEVIVKERLIPYCTQL
jgi:hypothetical protein